MFGNRKGIYDESFFSTGNDSEFLLRLVDGHKKVEILPLSTVIRHLEIQVSEKRHRNTGQRLVF